MCTFESDLETHLTFAFSRIRQIIFHFNGKFFSIYLLFKVVLVVNAFYDSDTTKEITILVLSKACNELPNIHTIFRNYRIFQVIFQWAQHYSLHPRCFSTAFKWFICFKMIFLFLHMIFNTSQKTFKLNPARDVSKIMS